MLVCDVRRLGQGRERGEESGRKAGKREGMDRGWVLVGLKNTSLLPPFVPVSHVSKDLQRYQSNQLAQKSQGEPITSCQLGWGSGERLGQPSIVSVTIPAANHTAGAGSPKACGARGGWGTGEESPGTFSSLGSSALWAAARMSQSVQELQAEQKQMKVQGKTG